MGNTTTTIHYRRISGFCFCTSLRTVGPISGSKIEVTFDHRLSPLLLQELHRIVLDVCSIVPHGVVLFFTSYAYMDSVLAYWRENRLLSALEQVG